MCYFYQQRKFVMKNKEKCKRCGRKIIGNNKLRYCGRCKMEFRNKGIAVGGTIIAVGAAVAKAITENEDSD